MHANGAAQYFEEALKIRNLLQEFEAPERAAAGRRTGRRSATPGQSQSWKTSPSTCKPCHSPATSRPARPRLSACNWRGAASPSPRDLSRRSSWRCRSGILAPSSSACSRPHSMCASTTATQTSSTSFTSSRAAASPRPRREINLSEDVFAGYKTTLHGGRVVFREYHQAEKVG